MSSPSFSVILRVPKPCSRYPPSIVSACPVSFRHWLLWGPSNTLHEGFYKHQSSGCGQTTAACFSSWWERHKVAVSSLSPWCSLCYATIFCWGWSVGISCQRHLFIVPVALLLPMSLIHRVQLLLLPNCISSFSWWALFLPSMYYADFGMGLLLYQPGCWSHPELSWLVWHGTPDSRTSALSWWDDHHQPHCHQLVRQALPLSSL